MEEIMNLKSSYRYRLKTSMKSVIIYYIVIAILCMINLALSFIYSGDGSFFNGIEVSSMIFLFVIGLNSFKEDFYMLLQNGISRKAIFTSTVLQLATLTGAMALLDYIAAILMNQTGCYNLIFKEIYYWYIEGNNILSLGFSQIIAGFFWSVSAYFLVASLGLLITLFYYKASHAVRLAVSIGVPVVFLIILPSIDMLLAPVGQETLGIFARIGQFILRLVGYGADSAPNPWIGTVSFLVLSAILHSVNWLMMKKALVK